MHGRPTTAILVSSVLFLFLPLFSRAQFNVDSLKQLLVKAQEPVEHLRLLKELSRSPDAGVGGAYALATVRYADSLVAHGHAGDTAVLTLRGTGLWNIGSVYTDRGMLDSALVPEQQAIAQWTAIGDKDRTVRWAPYLAQILISRGNVREAMGLMEQCLDVHSERKDTAGLAQDHGSMGLAYYAASDYPRALDHSYKAVEFARIKGLPEVSALNLANIAVIFEDLGQADTAIAYYERALPFYEQLPNKSSIASPLNNLAALLMMRGQYTEALAMCNKALAGIGKDQWPDMTGMLYGTIGSIHRTQGDLEQASHYGELSVAAAERGVAVANKVVAFTQYGTTLLAQDRYREALQQAKKAKEIADHAQVRMTDRMYIALLFSQIYTKTGPAEMTLRYYQEYEALKDSVDSEDTRKKLARMDLRKQALADSLRSEEETHRVALLHQQEMNAEQNRKRLFMFGGIGLFMVAGGLWARLRYTRRAKRAVEKEHARSESLLLNILPSEIAEELKNTGGAVARDIANVSILFTDFKGFTQMSEQLSAQELVSEINTCFKAFDDILGTHGVEKIKTIGDAYMAAGGLPVPSDQSVLNTVLAALEMQAFMHTYKADREAQGKPAFEMRVGIHTGPVVAGIVGVKKFQYDIWGDTVNTASRMESSGEVGQVNISESTYALVKDETRLTFTGRGKVQAKGKGEMEMFFVRLREART